MDTMLPSTLCGGSSKPLGPRLFISGHNRSVWEVVSEGIQEDVQAIGVSCYQGGHIEYFKCIVDLLKEHEVSHVRVFGGGGGVIVPEEIQELEAYGVAKIYSPEDGRKWGLQGMIDHLLQTCDFRTTDGHLDGDFEELSPNNWRLIAQSITAVEIAKASGNGDLPALQSMLQAKIGGRKTPVLGITGTGGAGKSSLTDEIVLRFA